MGSTILREIKSWKQDHWQLALVSWLPLLLFVSLWWIFSAGIATGLSIGVVDLDGSRLSRTLIRNLDATAALEVTMHPASVHKGRLAMSNAEINALLVIPHDFQARVTKGLNPDVTAFYNGQFILIGKAINKAQVETQATLAGMIDGGRAMARGAVLPQAAGLAAPIIQQMTPLYNRPMDYALFLVPAIIPALWQVVMVVGMLNALGREKREGSWDQWLEAGAIRAFTGKMLPYVVVYWTMGLVYLGCFHLLGWPMQGSWALIVAAQGLTAVASAVMAGLLFAVVGDLARALSLAAAYTAPSFAFLGVTFPTSDMPALALFWRSLIPVCHYIDIQISQMSRATEPGALLWDFGALMLFVAVVPLVVQRLVPSEPRP